MILLLKVFLNFPSRVMSSLSGMPGSIQPQISWSLPMDSFAIPVIGMIDFCHWVSIPEENVLYELCVPSAVTRGVSLLTSRGEYVPLSVRRFDVSYQELNALLLRMCSRPCKGTSPLLHDALNSWGFWRIFLTMPKVNTIANRFASLGVSLEGLTTKFDVWDAIGRSGAFTHPDLTISATDFWWSKTSLLDSHQS